LVNTLKTEDFLKIGNQVNIDLYILKEKGIKRNEFQTAVVAGPINFKLDILLYRYIATEFFEVSSFVT